MRLWIELAAASRPDHPAHIYFVERYERTALSSSTDSPTRRPAAGFVRASAPRLPPSSSRPRSTAFDIVRPVTDFVRMLFGRDAAQGLD